MSTLVLARRSHKATNFLDLSCLGREADQCPIKHPVESLYALRRRVKLLVDVGLRWGMDEESLIDGVDVLGSMQVRAHAHNHE